MLITKILFFTGMALISVGHIWALVIAFRKDVLWGLACLLFGLPILVFLVLYWDDCRRAFLTAMAGFIICLVGMILIPTFEIIS